MKSMRAAAAAALFAIALPASQAGEVLTFEDLGATGSTFDLVPAGYAGLHFYGWFFGVDTVYPTASGAYDLFNNFADPSDPTAFVLAADNSIERVGGFHFDGAWFSGYSGVRVELWRDGQEVWASEWLPHATGASPYGPSFVAGGYAGLADRMLVRGVQGYFAMDDLGITLPAPLSVPSTLLLSLCAGLAVTGLGRGVRQSVRPRP